MLQNNDRHTFYVRPEEVDRLCSKYGFETVTQAIKFLFPDYIFYRVSRSRNGGYWGQLPYPRRILR